MTRSKQNSIRQQKLVALLADNLGNGRTMYELMIEAGYSPTSAHQQTGILTGIRDQIEPFVQEMIGHRSAVIEQMKKKLPKAQYHHLVESLDKLTKNIQLLSGRPTDRSQVTGLEDMTDDELRQFIAQRASGSGAGSNRTR